MRKNLIKLLSGVLFCAAITTSPALAAENASNTIDELNSLIDVLKSDNILTSPLIPWVLTIFPTLTYFIIYHQAHT